MGTEIRYVIQTALDIYVVSNIKVTDNYVEILDVDSSQMLQVPKDSIVVITKETVTAEDVTDELLHKQLVEVN